MYKISFNKKYPINEFHRKIFKQTNWYGAYWFTYHKKHRFFKHKVIGIIIGEQPFLMKILVGIHEAIHVLFCTVFCFLNNNTMEKIQKWYDWLWTNAVFSQINHTKQKKGVTKKKRHK